jgi:hypothetical protein
VINAPPDVLYGIIADYRNGHPKILPMPPFLSLDVEEGGVGAGTVIRVRMRMLGQTQTFRARITEPDPGRLLLETNDNGYVSTFWVEPRGSGDQAEVTITTELKRAGVSARVEAWLAARLLPSVYRRELQQLALVAAERGDGK